MTSNIYVSPITINNVLYCNKNLAMILWKFYCMMIYIYTMLINKCTPYRRSKDKDFLSTHYCEKRSATLPGKVKYNSYLWSLERMGSPPIYLFGTVHAPYDLVWRYIPANAKDALFDSTDVFTEVNLKDQKVINDIRRCRQLPNNMTLKDVLPKDLHNELIKGLQQFEKRKQKWIKKFTQSFFKEYLVQARDVYKLYFKLKPVWLISTILQQWNKFAVKLMFNPRLSLDSYIVKEADQMGIYGGGIEDVSMHCDPMNNLGKRKVNIALNATLHAQRLHTSSRWNLKENDIRNVANLYKCGDPLSASKLGTLFSGFVTTDMKKELEEIDEYLTRELVYKRNVLMAKRIDEMANQRKYTDAKMFFALGAAHLIGNDSIVSLLQNKGYTIKHIQPDEEIPATIEKNRLMQEGRQFFADTMNTSIWRRTGRKEMDNKPIIVIKRVERNYVYYYNSANRVLNLNLIVFTLLSLMWFFR